MLPTNYTELADKQVLQAAVPPVIAAQLEFRGFADGEPPKLV